MRRRVSPVGALFRGMAAGVVGTFTQDLYFRAMKRVKPRTPREVFQPPEPEQQDEQAVQTVARRFVEGMMARPLREEHKRRAGVIVHRAFGAGWGGLWGLVRESVPAVASPTPIGLAGLTGFSALVWMVGDNLILPAFRLAAWPQRYAPALHAYAFGAHVAYGLGTCLSYELMRPPAVAAFAGIASTIWLRRGAFRRLPAPVRPALRRAASTIAAVRANEWIGRGRAALEELRG